jgi:hypothetical protein
MAVQQEIKSQLAKLLATEDLVVEHKQTETACFNVHTRVLTLPMWERASNTVYDLLVGHEVGHALFTPDENWLEKVAIPPQFVNVVEDARIEKMMKRKYAGLAKTFYHGYKELQAEDFFSISDSNVADLNLADRANLYFKVGNFIDISFTEEEMAIIRMIEDCETFDEVLQAAEELYLFCKNEKEEKVDDSEVPPEISGSTDQPANQLPQESPENSGDGGDSDGSGEGVKSDTQKISGDIPDDLGVQTAESLEGNLRDLVNSDGSDNVYVEVPKVNLDVVIAKNDDVHHEIDRWFNRQQENFSHVEVFGEVDAEFVKFKRSAQKEVNYLVKEFECKKAADSYARATTARTGVLDTTKLHTYKYNEDLFKKVTTLADGKNHGLVFILDWSGSMSRVLLDTCKQLFNLVWFCKKVGIPFDVYAFTNEWERPTFDLYNGDIIEPAKIGNRTDKKEYTLAINDDFSLMNLFTSKTNGKELEKQMKNIWRVATYHNSYYRSTYTISPRLSLSGTPLNETIVALHEILPKFQKENKLQKVQCVILTDGEANDVKYNVEIIRPNNRYMGQRRVRPESSFLRDRKTGNTYKFDYGWHTFTQTLLTNMRDKFPSVNFIGMRVLEGRGANDFIKLYYNYGDTDYDKIMFDWRKNRSFCIKKSGYHAYFGLSATALSQDSEFEVDDGATKAKIKSAFVKSLKTKKLNKKVLGEFISLVA